MNSDLEKKIREDLKESGFGSEMRAAQMALESGWNCQPGASYLDLQQAKTREIDLHLGLVKSIKNRVHSFAEYYVMVEVKKSSRPWIVLSKEKTDVDTEGWSNPSVHAHLPFLPSRLASTLNSTSILAELPWIGYGVHEFAKKPNRPSTWYKAALGSCKACAYIASRFYAKEDVPHPEEDREPAESILHGDGEPTLILTQPVVVLDGIMVRAWIDEDAKMQVESISMAPLRVHLRTKGHLQSSFRVDLVTLDHLSQYLRHHKERFERIVREVKLAA